MIIRVEEPIIRENEKEMVRIMIPMIIRSRIVERLIIRENNEEKKIARMMIIRIVERLIIRESEKEMVRMTMIINGGENEKEMTRKIMIINSGENEKEMARMMMIENNGENEKEMARTMITMIIREGNYSTHVNSVLSLGGKGIEITRLFVNSTNFSSWQSSVPTGIHWI